MTEQGLDWVSARTAAAEREEGTPFDLAECVREPIHRLGAVQSYGALVAVRAGRVVLASENAEAVLGVAPVLGTPVDRLLDQGQVAALSQLAESDPGQTVLLPAEVAGARFDVSAHRAEGLLVLEFEPVQPGLQPLLGFHGLVRQALVRLQRSTTVAQACQAAVREIRALTGYDRVVAYRFEALDGPGEVIAEEVVPDWEPWLGLWFPATDIPPQARLLYERNWIRVIADVADPSARLVAEREGPPLDLSLSVLRTVSPFHLEYLRNIGVGSSMSVSLLLGGRLWGLIACHGRAPKILSPQVRSACEFFGVALSLHLAGLRDRDTTAAREDSRVAIARLLERVSMDLPTGWAQGLSGLEQVLGCEAVAVRSEGRLQVHGTEVDPARVAEVLAALPPLTGEEMWHSDRLGEDLPTLADRPDLPAGALVLPLGARGDCIVWLRAERRVARRWAVDPRAPVTVGPHGRRLTPRGSTAVYLASVRGRSLPWSDTDLAMALELGRSILAVAVAHAQELSVLNTELHRSNLDLDSFAHAAAHDLKEPLRGIANTATFIVEDAAEQLDEVTARRLASIQRLATRMDLLLNTLLHYSLLGRTDLNRQRIELLPTVREALEVVGPRLTEAAVRVQPPEAGTYLLADPVLFGEVLVNLLVNAAKYVHPEGPRTVEVGVAPVAPPGHREPEPALFVRDNGIGIPEHLREQAFDLFRRLHPEAGAAPEGSGAGLAIVRRIVERHGGQAWAGESPGGGTTIWATFPEREERQ